MSDPEVAGLLAEMGELFEAEGVDLSVITPAEVTQMPKAGGAIAIPPPAYWPRMALTLREVFMPLREAMGVPLAVRGYRPPDYNRAVGGAPKSRHQAFEALDIRVAGSHSTAGRRRELAERTAALYRERGGALKLGFGAYGYPIPGNVHVDTGHQRRAWRDASRFVSHQRAVSPPFTRAT
ncbi:MAG: hypothetical protein K0V04_02970 [Deltaproteobacteria bacterium]|nr:hypothetical protein [Deltaproteobacteria bacterium]